MPPKIINTIRCGEVPLHETIKVSGTGNSELVLDCDQSNPMTIFLMTIFGIHTSILINNKAVLLKQSGFTPFSSQRQSIPNLVMVKLELYREENEIFSQQIKYLNIGCLQQAYESL
jgi:hypothetical protein